MKFLSQINVNTRYTLPMVDGTNGQVLSTDGNGVAYWGTISAGSFALDGLSDVIITSPSTGQILRYGIPAGSGEVNPVWHNVTPNYLTPSSSIDALGDVTISTATTGQILQWSGSAWVNATLTTAGYISKVQHEVKAGEAITKGKAVYVTGADGTNMVVGLASNTGEGTSSKTMGIALSTAAVNGKFFVVTEGLIDGLNTSTATAGDAVWLGTNGNLIFGLVNKPVAPAHLVYLGVVTRVNQNNGEIFVNVQNGFELKELHDVLINGVSTGQLIRRDSDGLWKNWTPNFLTSLPAHTHNDIYYTEGEIDSLFAGETEIDGYNRGAWDVAYNDKINSASFSTTTGVLTLTQQDTGTVTVDLDGRYLEAEADTLQSVTSRGSSTNTDIRIKRPSNKVDNASCTELPSRVEFNNAFVAGSTGYTVFTYPTSSVFRIYGDYDGNVGGVQPDLQLGLGYLTVKNSGGTIGNVGIGTTSPNARLTVVANDSSNPNVALRLSSTGYSGVTYPYTSIRFGSAYSSYPSWNLASIDAGYTGASWGGSLLFYTNNDSGETNLTERMRITSAGNVGIGTTSPSAKLDVNGAANATSFSSTALFITNADTSGSLQPDQGDPANKIYSFRWQGNEGGYIDTDNKITFSGFKTPAGTSSQFLKANGTVDSSTYLTSTALNGYATQAWVNTNYYDRNLIDDFFSGAEAITGYNKSNWDAAYNDKINSASFNTTTGVLTLTQQDLGTVTVDLDGRYITSETDSQTLTWTKATSSLTISNGNSVTLEGLATEEYVTSQGYLTSLPAHNHDSRYYTETESDSRFYLATNPNGYITSSGNTSGYSASLSSDDNRTISPSEAGASQLRFGFTSWANNNSAPYADYLHLRSYGDSSGGSDNLVMFKKSGIGMRIWQQTWGSATAYSSYVDVWTTGDFSSTDISNWNAAYGWGDHAAAGYLTSFSYTETDTLSSVTGRGGSTGSPVVMYGKVTLGNNSSGTYSGNTTGLTLNSTAEVRSTGVQNPPALTWHYEGLATRHLLMTSAGAFNFVSPSNEASGVAVVQVNGNTVWHAGNLTNLNQLTNGPGYITGYTETDTLASVTGRGATTTTPITLSTGTSQPLSLTTANGSPWHLALNRTDLGLTSRVFAHNSPYNGWYFEHNISIAGNTNWHSGNFTDNSANWNTAYNDRISSATVTGTTTKTLTLTQGDGGTVTATWTDYDTDNDAQQLTWDKPSTTLSISNGNSVALEGLATEEFVTGQGYITGDYLPLSGGTLTGTLTMGTTGTQYIRMGRFPGSTTNTGEAWIGRASDRNTGTMTVQLGGNSASSRSFEVVDYAWSVVLFSVGSNGNLTVSGTITENSSIRYKKDVVDIESTSSKVQLLRPVKYKKIRDESEEIGLIAEDVAELFPEVVKYDNEGRPDGVNYSRLSVILLKAMQELTERVNKLENK